MEEPDERDSSRSVSESTVVDDSSVSVSKERVQNSLSEEVGRAEGGDGACNGGEDIMVEVLGSDVYFDGVCTDRTAGNLDGVCSTGDRDGVSPCRDSSVVDEEPDVGVSGGVESEGVAGVRESIEEEASREGVEDRERAADDARADDSPTGVSHVEEKSGGSEAMDVDTQVVSCQGTLVRSSSDDKVLSNEEPHKVEVHTEQSKNSPTENGFGDNSVHAGGRSQIVSEEATITDGGESMEKGPGQKNVEEGEQIVDMPVDRKDTELGVSDADASNPGIKASTSSADGSENSNSQGQDVTEKAPNMFIEKDLNPEVISHSDGSEKNLSNLERDESCTVEMDHGDIGKSDHVDDHNQVAGGGEFSNSILTHGKKISDDEQLGLCAGPESIEVPERTAQALDSENLDPSIAIPENMVHSEPSIAVPENVARTESISSSQPNQDAEVDAAAENDDKILAPGIEVSAGNEQNLNVQIEHRSVESDPQSNGQGGGIGMNSEENALIANNLADFENVEEMEVDQSFHVNQVGLHGEEEMDDVRGFDNDDDQIVEYAENPESSAQLHQARYQLPAENEGDFSVSDLVWGKVRSHPWWPGQIFDPSDSSDKAMKYYKKDFFLVAYFGDRTFAWNEGSHLKPFRTHFSEEEMKSSSETFQNAVECALEEVSRRSELGLACACTPKEAYDMIKCQIIENAGIREESSRRYGVDKSASATSFEPAKLIEYIRDLAKFPSDSSDRLELVIAKAQLTAFYRLKGYSGLPQFQFGGLPQFQFCGGLADNESDSLGIEMQSSDFVQHAAPCQEDAEKFPCKENLGGRSSSYHKRKHNLKDGLYPKKKEKSLYELMGENLDNLDGENWSDVRMTTALVSPSTKRRKTVEHPTDDSGMPDGRKTISSAKVSGTAPLKQSFKIGDCIRRVASQLTGTSPIVKSTSERLQKPDGSFDGHVLNESEVFLQNFDDAQRGRVSFPTEYSSLDELLGQLQLVASDPMQEYSFLNVFVNFFTDFRDSLILRQQPGIEEAMDRISGKRRAQFTSIVASPQTFEFEDMSDTYWTDRVIQNGTEVQPPRKTRKRDFQLAVAEPEKPLQGSRRPYKKRHSAGNHTMPAEKFTGSVDQSSPAELVMNFSEVDSVPSEKTLNNMFRRYGPLRESETEVDREGGRARVVFKKSSDAEIAYGSAGRFNIFGPRLVNYQLSYTPSTLFKASPIPRLQDQEMHLDLSSTQFQEMQLDLSSFHDHDMQLDLSSIHDQDMQLDLSTIEYQEMESVLGPNHDQESKPNYTAHLGDMQAGYSTIQYERQSDLSSMHDQDLQTVFASNLETQSGPVTSQDQELHHNFTSTQLGEMQADHTLTSHHDEPQVSALGQEQNMQPAFATIKEEKTQPAITTYQEESQSILDTIQEQETLAILDTAQLGSMQADLTPTHHEEHTVPATSLEQERQPVFAMIQEGTQPVLATSQEQEKVAIIGTATVHHEEEQPVPSTPQEQDMQPVLPTVQENEMLPGLTSAQDHEREPLTTSEELFGEPVPAMTEEQESQHALGTMKGHEEEDVLGTKEQATQSVTTVTHEQEDTQPVGLMGEEAQGETQLAPVFTEGQETQVLDSTEGHETQVLDSMEGHETQVLDSTEGHETQVLDSTEGHETQVLDSTEGHETQVLDSTEGHETQVLDSTEGHETQVLDSTEEHETQVLDSMEGQDTQVLDTTEEQETQVLDSTEEQETKVLDSMEEHETQVLDSMEEHETQVLDSTEEQETQVLDSTDGQETQVLDTTEKHETQVLDIMEGQETQVLDTIEEHETQILDSMEGQETQVLDTTEGHESEHDLGAQEQATQSVIVTDGQDDTQSPVLTGEEAQEETLVSTQELESEPDLTSAQSLEHDEDAMQGELQPDHVKAEEQEAVPDSLTSQVQDMQSNHTTELEQDLLPSNATNEVPEVQCDDETKREQDLLPSNATNEVPEVQCDDDTNREQESQHGNNTNQEQEMQCDVTTDQGQEEQCDNATSQEQEMQCDSATNREQEMQCDSATSQEQEMQCDNTPSQEQDMQCGNAPSQEQEQEMQCDNATSQEQEMQCDNVTNQEQEMECDNDADKKHVVQPDEAASIDQDAQSDHEQELQADHATNLDQETESNFATKELNIKSDVADEHPTQDQATESDLATIPDSETHPDPVPTKDQETQLGLSSLEKNTD